MTRSLRDVNFGHRGAASGTDVSDSFAQFLMSKVANFEYTPEVYDSAQHCLDERVHSSYPRREVTPYIGRPED